MDQNWYTQDLSAQPPTRRSYRWVWILGGCLFFFGMFASDDVTAEEVTAIESFLKHLTTVLQKNDDETFAAERRLLEFKDRVRLAASLSFTARGQCRKQFDEWFTMYSPYSSAVSRIQLVSVKRGSSDHSTLIDWTWVFNSEYPDRVAWYLRSNGTEMRLVDFEMPSTLTINLSNSPRVPPKFQGELAEASTFTVLDWREE